MFIINIQIEYKKIAVILITSKRLLFFVAEG